MLQVNRRQFLTTAGTTAAALAFAPLIPAADDKKAAGHSLPKLSYAYDALEKAIDAKTMEIHHSRHHQAYVDNLNKALADQPSLQGKSLLDLVRGLKPGTSAPALINNGGGHANHTMFWEMMTPQGGGEPSGELGKAIDGAFGSYAKFQEQLALAAMGRFGSGWAWLVVDQGKLKVVSTANQESPLMSSQTPLLGIDVWEHAYYLRYQNKRADYVKAWWQVVNWKDVAERYRQGQKG